MRRFSLLAALVLPLLIPAAVNAESCPAPASGVVDKASYRLGEVIDFFGTYHDFADPGKVTITFERTTDGAIREFTAFNSADGSWYLMLDALDSTADVGRWNVTVVVDQTGSVDTCTDVVTIRGRSSMPNTDTVAAAAPEAPRAEDASDAGRALWLVLAGFAALGALAMLRRRLRQPQA